MIEFKGNGGEERPCLHNNLLFAFCDDYSRAVKDAKALFQVAFSIRGSRQDQILRIHHEDFYRKRIEAKKTVDTEERKRKENKKEEQRTMKNEERIMKNEEPNKLKFYV